MRLTITPRRTLVALVTIVVACLAPQVALADDYCVARAGCDANHTFPASGLQTALDDAHATLSSDRVLLGPGHYPWAKYLNPALGGALEIAGAGADQTIIDGGTFGLFVTGHGTSIHDLGVKVAVGGIAYGVITDGSASNIMVTGGPGAAGAVGLALGADASLDHVTVSLPGGGTGLQIDDNATVVDSTIAVGTDGATSTGVEVTSSQIAKPVTLKRLGITAADPLDVSVGQVRISDSLLDLGAAPFGTGIYVHSNVNGPFPQVTADRVTIAGHADVAQLQTGVRAEASGIGAVVGLTVENSVIANVRYAGMRLASDGYAHLGMHHTVYTPGAIFTDQNTGTGTGAFEQDGVTAADPRFVDAAHRDYRPRFDSPLVDHSDLAVIAPGPTDLGGAPRMVDGNGDGSPTIDLGAYEYQRQAPVVAAADATPAAAIAGQPVTLSGTATDTDPGEQPTGAWTFGDGGGAAGLSVSHVYGAAGTYAATFTATDATGLTATRTVTVTVSLPAAIPAAAPAGGVATTVRLTDLHLTPSRFRKASFLPGKAHTSRGGTTISVRASEAAMLTLRLVGKHGRNAGLLHLQAHAGINAIRFGGRLTARSGLRAGSYILTVSAATATPVKARLTVLG